MCASQIMETIIARLLRFYLLITPAWAGPALANLELSVIGFSFSWQVLAASRAPAKNRQRAVRTMLLGNKRRRKPHSFLPGSGPFIAAQFARAKTFYHYCLMP